MRRFLPTIAIVLSLSILSLARAQERTNTIPREEVVEAEKLLLLNFSDAKTDQLLPGMRELQQQIRTVRNFHLSNSVPPAITFNPIPVGFKFETERRKFRASPVRTVKLPSNMDDLAFYSVAELGALIKSRQLSSETLTRFCLDRLKKYGPKLECVVTLTEDRALAESRRADAEIKAGHYRGLLHGIPYGAKDLLAARGAPTTWGSAPYTNQVFDSDATVIQRLEKAGAVLVVKTTLGELAMGETWFGGMTRNPWSVTQGSSGSSAGSCAATSAGLVPFAIGSETLGSIVSPCDRCGVTGLRPSYGRVSRTGAMTLSWTMDKLGPICRTAEDCALVFEAIYGPDGQDQTLYDAPFNYDPKVDLRKIKIGYLKGDFERERGERKEKGEATLKRMRELGADLIPVELPDYPVRDLQFVLSTEAAAAFDDLTISEKDDLMKQQGRGAWPNTFRERRFVPAVEFLQAQRIRYLLIQDTAKVFQKVDLFLTPPFTGRSLLISNLTGNPCVVMPNGFTTNGTPTSVCFIGKLFGEARLLAVARTYQQATDFHKKHPKLEL